MICGSCKVDLDELNRLRAEAELARKRLGPAGYRILQEHPKLQLAVEEAREILRKLGAHDGYLPNEVSDWLDKWKDLT